MKYDRTKHDLNKAAELKYGRPEGQDFREGSENSLPSFC
jgi:hypothetical protein